MLKALTALSHLSTTCLCNPSLLSHTQRLPRSSESNLQRFKSFKTRARPRRFLMMRKKKTLRMRDLNLTMTMTLFSPSSCLIPSQKVQRSPETMFAPSPSLNLKTLRLSKRSSKSCSSSILLKSSLTGVSNSSMLVFSAQPLRRMRMMES